MSGRLVIHNRQHSRPVNTGYLRRIVQHLLNQLRPGQPCTLGVCLLSSKDMTRLNETFVHHQGCTDVITFDYADGSNGAGAGDRMNAEIFVCLDEAVR